MDLIGQLTSSLTSKVTESAKTQVVSTLKDPEIKAAASKFVKDIIEENKVILALLIGGIFILTTMAVVNIITSFRSR